MEKIVFEKVLPEEIEQRSFEIIGEELAGRSFRSEEEPIIKRVIHTTADFSYADSLCFSSGAITIALEALRKGAAIVSDTTMVQAGIHKKTLERLGGRTICHIGSAEVAKEAADRGTTRSSICMEKTTALEEPFVVAVGNAPTALIRLYELIMEERIKPVLVIGVPVGFVNVVQSKELIMQTEVPFIVARGRKGGSNVAAAVCNALLYMASGER